jgi:hypothetical protein
MSEHTHPFPPVLVSFDGVDGNALSDIGHWRTAARDQGWDEAAIEAVSHEAITGDYAHVLRTLLAHSESPDGDEV